MNDVKLQVINSIKNSSLEDVDKDKFIEFIEFISEKSALNILVEIKSNGNDIGKTWKRIMSKILLLQKIEDQEILTEDQKKDLKNIIINLDNEEVEGLLVQLKKGKISTEEIRDENEIFKKYHQELIKKIEDSFPDRDIS